MRRGVALLLALGLATGLCNSQEGSLVPVREQIRTVAPDTPVEVRFHDGSKIRGWIAEVSDSGFVLNHEVKRKLQRSQFTLDSVRAVQVVNSVKPSHTRRNILIGVGIGVVVVFGALLGLAASGGLGPAGV
ncbi:MAG TPA: hypothetical protein VMT32_21520 [Bryobacteraceae bacterium]|nr:hypothetical protein [Bryobacteraceae bacterium]